MENLGMNQAFWKGRRVFMTGHTGFKGSWLALLLQVLGAEVHGLALSPATTPALFTDARIAQGMHSHFGDIRSLETLLRAVRDAQPEIVLHLAAQAIVSESFDRPLETLHTNIIGTANLLEAVRTVPGVKAVVIVTSDKCYENNEAMQSYREDQPLGGNDPYSASKACTELVAASWRYSFFDGAQHPVIATARAGNVIGGGDWSRDRLIPDMVRAFLQGTPAMLRNPEAIRPWQHVLEPLCGYLQVAERCAADPAFGQAWNFGPDHDDTKAVREIADMLAQLWGEGARWQQQGHNPVKEARTLKLDSSKAQSQLPWRPVTDIADGLRLTAQWYKGYAAQHDVRSLTEQQIHEFLARSHA
jgi:CDP-glucose 4,6-dehydratase